jgi:L-aspartate oxidase
VHEARETLTADFVVVGSGVAGLRAAIELAAAGTVLVLAKSDFRESASSLAQGGVAAALSDEDEVGLHEQDTLRAGDGLCNGEAVRILVEEGPARIRELITWGTRFDRSGRKLAFTREGAHSRSRILHAHGDSTGREIVRVLLQRARRLRRLTLLPHAFTIDLRVEEGTVRGLEFLDERSGRLCCVNCQAVLLATGGLGQLYRVTTNPPVATGDGMAIALRAGAVLADMEFVQFHPTALAMPGAPAFLLSEALRGEGAVLRNAMHERFMPRYHEAAELAPRDVVARAIVTEMKRTRSDWVYLDLTALQAEFVRRRFPRIYQTCLSYGVDLTTDLVPVRPAAHYAMGGVRTDLEGRTHIRGLYAAGEVACTGVHGANRLASNSLLEGLVFGARAGKAMVADWVATTSHTHKPGLQPTATSRATPPAPPCASPDPVRTAVQNLMWEHVGILRDRQGLLQALDRLEQLSPSVPPQLDRPGWETYNLWLLARAVARCALAREESRGSHYRSDFPYRDDERFARHSVYFSDDTVRFE